jgi:hypothetical protein
VPSTSKGIPYPVSTDPVAAGASNMQAIAEALDARIPSTATALPASPYDGQTVLLRLGASPFTFLRMTWDATLARWVSDVDYVPLMRDPMSVITQTDVSVYTELSTSYTDLKRPWKAMTAAGLAMQYRFTLMFGNTINNVTYRVRPRIFGIDLGNAGWTAAVAVTNGELTNLSPSTTILRDTGWLDLTVGTPADWIRWRVEAMRDTGGTGKAGLHSEMLIQTRWVKA